MHCNAAFLHQFSLLFIPHIQVYSNIMIGIMAKEIIYIIFFKMV